jgi:hypothetical protein
VSHITCRVPASPQLNSPPSAVPTSSIWDYAHRSNGCSLLPPSVQRLTRHAHSRRSVPSRGCASLFRVKADASPRPAATWPSLAALLRTAIRVWTAQPRARRYHTDLVMLSCPSNVRRRSTNVPPLYMCATIAATPTLVQVWGSRQQSLRR